MQGTRCKVQCARYRYLVNWKTLHLAINLLLAGLAAVTELQGSISKYNLNIQIQYGIILHDICIRHYNHRLIWRYLHCISTLRLYYVALLLSVSAAEYWILWESQRDRGILPNRRAAVVHDRVAPNLAVSLNGSQEPLQVVGIGLCNTAPQLLCAGTKMLDSCIQISEYLLFDGW